MKLTVEAQWTTPNEWDPQSQRLLIAGYKASVNFRGDIYEVIVQHSQDSYGEWLFQEWVEDDDVEAAKLVAEKAIQELADQEL